MLIVEERDPAAKHLLCTAVFLAGLLLSIPQSLMAATLPSDPPLTREDHTRIVQFVVVNAAAVRKQVDTLQPTGEEVLHSALKVPLIDTYTRARIETVLRLLGALEPGRSKIAVAEQGALDEIAGRLAASPTLTTRMLLLEDLDIETMPEGRYARFNGVNSGLIAAGRFTADGLTTIYSVDWVYTALSNSPTRMVIHNGPSTEIGGGAQGNFSQIWALTKSVFDRGVHGAMVGAASYYANRVPDVTVAECATAYGIGESVRDLIRHIN